MRIRIAVGILVAIMGNSGMHGQVPPPLAEPSLFPQLVVQPGQNGRVLSLQFGGEGRWLVVHSMVTGSQTLPYEIRIVDMRSGRTVRMLESSVFALHPVKDLIVVGRPNGAVAMHPATGREGWKLEMPAGVATVGGLQFSGDGRTLSGRYSVSRKVLGLTTGVRIYQATWDPDTGRLLSKPIEVGLKQVPYTSADGGWTLTVKSIKDNSMELEIRDARTGERVGPTLNTFPIAMHAGVQRMVVSDVGSFAGTTAPVAKLLEAGTGRTLAALPGLAADFSRDGSKLVVTTITGAWVVMDSITGRTIREAPPSVPYSSKWALTPDGTRVVGVQQDALLIAGLDPAADVEVFRSGETPLLMAQQYDALLQKAHVGEQLPNSTAAPALATVTGQEAQPAGAFAPDGRWFVARASDGALDVWDLGSGNRLPFRLPRAHDAGALHVASSEALFRAAASAGSSVRVSTPSDRISQKPVEGLSVGLPALPRNGNIDSVCSLATGHYRVGESAMSDHEVRRLEAAVQRATELGMDSSVGCNLNATRTQMLTALNPEMVKQAKPKRTNPFTCRLAFGGCPQADMTEYVRGPMHLTILDIASGQVIATLRDDQNEGPENFRNRFGYLHWTLDGQFVLGGEMRAFRGARLRVWRASTGEQLRVPDELSSAQITGLLTDKPWIVASPAGFAVAAGGAGGQPIDVWNLETMQRIARLPSARMATVAGAYFNSPGLFSNSGVSSNGKVLVVASAGGSLEILDLRTGDRLGELRAMDNGDWLVTSPSGLFDGSPGGWRRLAWREGDKEVVESGELFFDEFYRPGLLAELLDGHQAKVARTLAVRDRRQPTVSLQAEAETEGRARVRVEIRQAGSNTDAGGVRDVRLFRNGLLVKAWRGEQTLIDGRVVVEASVAMVSGENRFAAYAFNRDDIRSQDAQVTLQSASPRQAPTVFILAIGVNRYANPEFNLTYAVPDATIFAERVAARQRELDPSSTVKVVTLLDGDATRDNIALAIERLSGAAPAALSAGAPKALEQLHQTAAADKVFVYFAGHGLAANDRFHLIPSDIAYRGPRSGVRDALDAVLARSISDADLEKLFEPMEGSDFTLVIDACQSGQAIGADGERFGPMNSRGLAQLAYEKGMSILTASQAYQAALESAQLGHGYLTFALIQEALASRVADRAPSDGSVTVDEWFNHAIGRVPALQLDALGRATLTGRDLRFDSDAPVAEASRLQTPRAFLKRDAASTLLVIARP